MRKNGKKNFQNGLKESMPSSLLQRLADAQDEIMTVEDLSNLLGVTKWAVLKRIQRGSIKAHKEGAYWYILKSEYISHLRRK